MGLLDNLKNALTGKKPQPLADTPEKEGETTGVTYTVKSGDTLWSIAQAQCGDGSIYLDIFELNKSVLESPEHIYPGQELLLPKP